MDFYLLSRKTGSTFPNNHFLIHEIKRPDAFKPSFKLPKCLLRREKFVPVKQAGRGQRVSLEMIIITHPNTTLLFLYALSQTTYLLISMDFFSLFKG